MSWATGGGSGGSASKKMRFRHAGVGFGGGKSRRHLGDDDVSGGDEGDALRAAGGLPLHDLENACVPTVRFAADPWHRNNVSIFLCNVASAMNITETNRIRPFVYGMQNRTFGSHP
jgi:hypothetical protein